MSDFAQNLDHLPPLQRAIRARCFHPAGKFLAFKENDLRRSVLDRFAEMVRKYPERPAVVSRHLRLSYRELDQAANRVAAALKKEDHAADGPVGLLFENDAHFVVASLGTIKASRVQLSLESTFSESRLHSLLEQSQSTILLSNQANQALARRLFPRKVIDTDCLEVPAICPVPSPVSADPGNVVTIDYTSGSTGEPKGMMWSQAGLLDVVARHTNVSHLTSDDRLMMFRASVRGYLSVLLNGGAYYPVDLHRESATELAEWLKVEEITIYRSAVSTFRNLVSGLDEAFKYPHLRLVLLFGEPAYQRDLEAYQRHFADTCLLATSLGCNEMDDYAYYFADKEASFKSGAIPGGYPVSDVETLILDEDGKSASLGEVGEIGLRANYPALGYWQRPESNKLAFSGKDSATERRIYRTGDLGRFDENGCLLHLGRSDFQVKIRGYRVDVSEVAAALLKSKDVREASVISRRDKTGDQRLIAYIVPAGSTLPSVFSLRSFLGAMMPDYMVPARFVQLEKMPLTDTGKIDQRALPLLDEERPALDAEFVPTRTLAEQAVAKIWGEVLELKEIGVMDNFYELGGDSLHAGYVIAKVMRQFDVRPSLYSMLKASTVAEMAALIVAAQAEEMEANELERLLGEVEEISEEEAQTRLAPTVGSREKRTSDLALVIPFYNEDCRLPWLIHSLREQDEQSVPVVFIDSASTDNSATLVRNCDEVKTGKWLLLEEKEVGKVRAMRAATSFCQERFGASYIGFLDSDSYLGDSSWISNSVRLISNAGERFGYSYSPINYFGFEKWPVFQAAYAAYGEVLQLIVKNIGWLANGQGFVCAIDVLRAYFESAELTTEVDLRCSLLGLLQGREAFLNPTVMISSGRRIVANRTNFTAWCFYDRHYYVDKDINASRKMDLKFTDGMEDLTAAEVKRFFDRRSLKSVCRHLMPLAIFSWDNSYFERMKSALDLEKTDELSERLKSFRTKEWILTKRFDEMIKAIEDDPVTIEAAEKLSRLTLEYYQSRLVKQARATAENELTLTAGTR